MRHRALVFVFIFCFLRVFSLNAQTMISGIISTSQTWNPSGSPYIINGTVQIYGSNNPVLTIEPGTDIRFAANAELNIGNPSSSNSRGGIVASGSIEQPIVFTADTDDPVAGYWKQLKSNLYLSLIHI